MSAFDKGRSTSAEWIKNTLSRFSPEDIKYGTRNLGVEFALILMEAVR